MLSVKSALNRLESEHRRLSHDATNLAACLQAWQARLSVVDAEPRRRHDRLTTVTIALQAIATAVVAMEIACGDSVKEAWWMVERCRADDGCPGRREGDGRAHTAEAVLAMERQVGLHNRIIEVQRETWAMIQRLEMLEGMSDGIDKNLTALLERLRKR